MFENVKETKIEDIEQVSNNEETIIKKKRGRKPGSKNKVSSGLTESEIKATFYSFFVGLSKLVKSDAEWTEEEFTNLAKAWLGFSNKFPVLRMIMLVLAPLAMLGDLISKFEKVMKGRRKKEENFNAEYNSSDISRENTIPRF